MNWKNIGTRYVKIGIPLFMLGVIIMAIGFIIDYLIIAVYGTSYFVIRLISIVGIIMMCIGVMAFPLMFKSVKK